MAERFREREGYYPSRILADKIYRNRENLRFCKEHGIRLSGPALGRPKKDEVRNKTQDFLDECDRVEVERRFSLAKRKCGLGLIVTKLQETIAHSVAMSRLAGAVLTLSFHSVTGLAAIALMAIHAVWASFVLRYGSEKSKKSFHKFSIFVWLIWLIPYISGMELDVAQSQKPFWKRVLRMCR